MQRRQTYSVEALEARCLLSAVVERSAAMLRASIVAQPPIIDPRDASEGGLVIDSSASPQTVGLNFLGAQISDTPGFIPPDSMGAVGPTQILVAVNGRIRTFSKSTGVADGALNSTTDTFFNSVRGGSTASDPRVRFDRQSGRWFISMITVTAPNRILIAASTGSTISSAASFNFFQFQQDLIGATPNSDTGGIADYDSLGVDKFALYIGANVFNAAGTSFVGSTGFVVNKANLLAGTLTVTAFRQMGTGSAAGPFAPRGVDNDDSNATEGYFIGVDTLSFSTLMIRRVSTPGSTPTLSANISLAVPTTHLPINQPALGSGIALSAGDDRLFDAEIHKNKITGAVTLWTAHNIEVNSSGVGTTGGGRNGSRWYEIQNLTTTPTVRQSGTLFDSAAGPRGFWMPSINESGQGHAAIGISSASSAARADVAVAGRLRTDTLGTLQPFTLVTASSTAYNVETGVSRQRWGDYSATVVDPTDDMTLWTFQEYCNATNSWGVRVVQLKAPPPATPASTSPSSVNPADSNVNVVLTGTSSSGSEFFDPGPDYASHISASVGGTGVTVNSVTFTDPTHVTLNLSVTSGAPPGARTITITNPDGQSVASVSGVLTVTTAPPGTPDMTAGTDNGVSSTDNTTNFAMPTFTGSVTAGAIVTLLLDGNPIGTDSATGGGTYAITPAAAISDGTHSLTATATVGGNTSPPSAALSIKIDTVAPTVAPVVFNFTTSQSLVYTFLEDVSQTLLSSSHLNVINTTTGDPVSVLGSLFGSVTVVRYSFAGGILADGNYTATITSGVTDVAGNPLSTNGTETVFFLNADANRDRNVNALDFNAIASHFGMSGDFVAGNFDYSGTVNTGDFNVLATRFNKVLPMASPPPPALAPAMSSIFSNQAVDDEVSIAGDLLRTSADQNP